MLWPIDYNYAIMPSTKSSSFNDKRIILIDFNFDFFVLVDGDDGRWSRAMFVQHFERAYAI